MPRKLSERQTSLHQCQVSELESALSSHKDKVRENVQCGNNASSETLRLLNVHIYPLDKITQTQQPPRECTWIVLVLKSNHVYECGEATLMGLLSCQENADTSPARMKTKIYIFLFGL